MKMHLINPFFRHASTFIYRPVGYEVIAEDNHLIYVKNGSMLIRIAGNVFHLKKDDILYSPKGIPYEFFSSSCDEGIATFVAISFDLTYDNCSDVAPKFPKKYTEDIKVNKERLITQLLNEKSFLKTPYVFNHAKQYYSYFSKMMSKFWESKEYVRDLCSCFLKELIINLHTYRESYSISCFNAIEVVTEYISDNYQKKLDNKFLSSLVGFHPNYLGRLFKRNFNCTIQQYIHNIRLVEAKKLITESELSLLEISGLCGFEDYPYFSAYFKKRTGLNPSQYRMQCKTIV